MRTLGSSFHPTALARSVRRAGRIGSACFLAVMLIASGRLSGANRDPAEAVHQAPTGMNAPAIAPIAALDSGSNGPRLSAAAPATAVAAGSTNSMEALDDKHRLAIGDRLSFRIVEDEEDPKPLTVMDSGEVEAPYIGRFPAEGRTCKQLALALKSALEREYYYQATVIVAVDLMAKSRGKVYLVGAVRMAGPQEIPSDEVFTLSKSVLRAGGFTDFADKTSVRVTRKAGGTGGKDQTFIVNVRQILEKGKTALDIPLMSGDFIYVSERTIRF